MRLYILQNLDSAGYDMMQAILVRAADKKQARVIAAQKAGDEGAEVWLSKKTSSCKQIKAQGAAGWIMRDYRAG